MQSISRTFGSWQIAIENVNQVCQASQGGSPRFEFLGNPILGHAGLPIAESFPMLSSKKIKKLQRTKITTCVYIWEPSGLSNCQHAKNVKWNLQLTMAISFPISIKREAQPNVLAHLNCEAQLSDQMCRYLSWRGLRPASVYKDRTSSKTMPVQWWTKSW